MKKIIALCAPLVSFFALVACVPPADGWDDEAEEDLGTAYQGQGGNPAIGGNHFSGADILAADARAAYLEVALVPLLDKLGYFPMIDVDESRRPQVVQNLVECALDMSQTVRDPVTDAEYTGHWGLATQWAYEPSTEDQQRWVTGCMIQRLNAWGHLVPILLEGATSPIYYNQQAEAEFPFNESTAWGNLFAGRGEIFVCSHEDQRMRCDLESKSVNAWLQERICDGLAECGMVYRGHCEDPNVCIPSDPTEDKYPVCYGWEHVPYEQTVHVQVQLSDATCTPAP